MIYTIRIQKNAISSLLPKLSPELFPELLPELLPGVEVGVEVEGEGGGRVGDGVGDERGQAYFERRTVLNSLSEGPTVIGPTLPFSDSSHLNVTAK